MTKREWGDLTPIRTAVAEIEQLEGAQYNDDVARALSDVRKKLHSALSQAENPELADGLTAEEYARVNNITRSAVYKRIRQNKIEAVRKPGVGYVIRVA